MATKPESTFYRGVHRLFKRIVPYFEKMSNPFVSGTADVWYSGDRGDLWIEYKFIPRIPRNAEILPDLTPRQIRWLNGRHDEGRNIAVVVGCPEGCVMYRNKEWLVPLSGAEFKERLISKNELALRITTEVGASKCNLSVPSAQPRTSPHPDTGSSPQP
jgi:hypothetical protein